MSLCPSCYLMKGSIPMLKLLITRHGETDWNSEQRFQGTNDVPLNALGEAQARDFAERVKTYPEKITAIYTSPYQRAYRSAEIVGEALGLTPIRDPRIQELNYGDWEGHTNVEIAQKWPFEWEMYKYNTAIVAPNAEKIYHLAARVEDFLEEMKVRHPDDTILIVTHGGVLAMIGMVALGIPPTTRRIFRSSNMALSIVEFPGVMGIIRCWNDTAHMKSFKPDNYF